MNSTIMNRAGFCIYVDTVCNGAMPVELNENGTPVVYPNLLDAQREIAENTIIRLRQFFSGKRDFEDAISVEEYIVEVDVFPDGSITDEAGLILGASDSMR